MTDEQILSLVNEHFEAAIQMIEDGYIVESITTEYPTI